ncbi:UvrD-helicase domain-containing protein [Paenibacillus tepidiphilus]|uniref:UvrD-helicase domain-containing protein n=1 Tax=Paenibacillus tepidiphilus TaxID=2608683 RepID=UPI0013A56326|nr:UvrD-helicase domain-containing protein [Paenibacillus tepidiphilus]
MLLHDENREKIESLLLGGNRHFQPEQVTVINSSHSTNIMACPGSGKTTVLIAKISLLLEKLKKEGSNKGICVITHTNVAVDEIIKSLNKLGISSIAYPHFIGTIHEFFNVFFSMKAYGAYTQRDTFYLMDNEEYKRYFERFFEYHRPDYWTYETPITAVDRTDIHIDTNDQLRIISRRAAGNYHESILNTIKDMFRKGFLRHSDTVELAKWYIRNHKAAIQQAFQNRFQYFFIDEAQDTSTDQYETLRMLIENNEETVVQWYGDSYQALYSLYGKEDAWRPSLEESLQINYSNRFGENIANILRTTCIEEYTTLKANVAINSAKPHLFIFNHENKEHLLTVYYRMVSEFKAASAETAGIKGKIAAVCHHHDSLEWYSEAYQRSKVGKPLYSQMQDCLHECHQSLLAGLRRNDSRDRTERNEYLKNISQFLSQKHPKVYIEIKAIWANWIRAINEGMDESVVLVELEAKYKECIAAVLYEDMTKIEPISMTNLRKSLEKILAKDPQSELSETVLTEEMNLELNTIHGVKGETHFATLLLESNRAGSSDMYSIFRFLTGTHQPELLEDSFVKDTLKLAYVALSRPRYFAGVAMLEENISDEDIHNAIRHGWRIVKVEEEYKPSLS